MKEPRYTFRDANIPYVKTSPDDFLTTIDVGDIRLSTEGVQFANATYKITCAAIRELARYEDTGLTPSEVAAMWKDMQEIKSCAVCANREKCDPCGDAEKKQFFCQCVRYEDGLTKLKWEWRGLAH